VAIIRRSVLSHGGGQVKTNFKITGASKKGTGFNGFADIVVINTRAETISVWEVKGSTSKAGAVAMAALATAEVAHYIKKLGNAKEYQGWTIKPGWSIGKIAPFNFRGPYGTEVVTGGSVADGGIGYYAQQPRKPQPPKARPQPVQVPVPQAVPEILPNPHATQTPQLTTAPTLGGPVTEGSSLLDEIGDGLAASDQATGKMLGYVGAGVLLIAYMFNPASP
jgi:hypothetical protein